jgi:hypothetical protein
MSSTQASSLLRTLCAIPVIAFAPLANAQDTKPGQTEEEFSRLLPISGSVDTFFGEFELDHSFPTKDSAQKIYDIMDHQRATQLYLWSLPVVATTRIRHSLRDNIEGYQLNRFVTIKRFNERRGFLTANESTTYFLAASDTSKGAVLIDIPPGKIVGMLVDGWQQGPADLGLFSEQSGLGGKHVIVGPNTPVSSIPEPSSTTDDFLVHRVNTDHVLILGRVIGTDEEIRQLSTKMLLRFDGEEPVTEHLDMQDMFLPTYQPRGLAYWEMLHAAINDEIVAERDRFFMYWLRDLGIEKGKPFQPTDRQKRILIDGARQGELMAKTLVYSERMDGVLRQNNWRMIMGGEWGDGMKYTQRMRYYDTFDPRARFTYEAVMSSPAMTIPRPGKSQAYLGKFEDEEGERLRGGDNYVIHIEADVPASLFWSFVIYDADTRCLIDNRNEDGKGKATVGSRTEGLRENADGTYDMLLGPGDPPPGWEANFVRTLPGRGWFPYMRAYGAGKEMFDDTYKLPTVTRVEDFSRFTR